MWIRARSISEASAYSLVVNVLMFFGALAFGGAVVRAFPNARVAHQGPPLSRTEIVLASLCVAFNALVMVAGWWLFQAGLLRVDGAPFGWRWIVDAALLVLVMDIAMYATHRVAHVSPIYRLVHEIHHRYDQPRPLTLFVLHPIEVCGFGALWIAVLCTHAFSLGGMLLYLTTNLLFGTLGHVGVEPLPEWWARVPILRAIGTSTFHARHHQNPNTNFGFYTAIWDRLFTTLDPHYASNFARLVASAERHAAQGSVEASE